MSVNQNLEAGRHEINWDSTDESGIYILEKTNLKTELIEIRPLTLADEAFLWEMLYQALYVPDGQSPFPRDILQRPEISRYVQGWGQPGDFGLMSIDAGKPVGAAWLRLLTGEHRGFGYVDEITPELTIAILPEHRGKGIGTQLMHQLLDEAQFRCHAVCLSVSSENPARRLYQRLGFEYVSQNQSSLTLVKYFGENKLKKI